MCRRICESVCVCVTLIACAPAYVCVLNARQSRLRAINRANVILIAIKKPGQRAALDKY